LASATCVAAVHVARVASGAGVAGVALAAAVTI